MCAVPSCLTDDDDRGGDNDDEHQGRENTLVPAADGPVKCASLDSVDMSTTLSQYFHCELRPRVATRSDWPQYCSHLQRLGNSCHPP